MLSTKVMVFFLCEYIVLAGIFAWERNWNKLLYWIGGCLIQYAVLKLK